MRAPYSRTLFDLLCEQAGRYPDAVAVVSPSGDATYAQLRERAGRAAAALRASGIGKHDRVGLLINNRLEWIDLCFGAAAIGAVLVPLSTWSKRRELEFLLADARIKLLLTLDRFGDQAFADDVAALVPEAAAAAPGTAWHAPRFPHLQTIVVLDGPARGGMPAYDAWLGDRAPVEVPAPGDGAQPAMPALVLYTSGSSANPKGVPLCHGPTIENGFNIGERQGLRAGEAVFLSSPLFWSFGSANAMCATFSHGGTLVLQGRFDAGEALDLIERHHCRAIYTLPGITSALVLHPSFRPERTASLRTGVTIGSPQDIADAAQKLGARELCNIYGQTESYGNCCVTWHHWPLERRMQVQGPPLPGVTVRIVDPETGRPVPQGTVGQIEVKGNVTPGYDGASAEHNATAFTADGYFRTGDLGLLTPEGDVQFAARDNEMIKKGGINIAPAEIEEILLQHPAVARAGVAGAPHPGTGEAVVAFVVPKPGMSVTADALRQHCRGLAASYKAPDRVEVCQELPVTPTGKLLRRELKRMAASLVGTKEGR